MKLNKAMPYFVHDRIIVTYLQYMCIKECASLIFKAALKGEACKWIPENKAALLFSNTPSYTFRHVGKQYNYKLVPKAK